MDGVADDGGRSFGFGGVSVVSLAERAALAVVSEGGAGCSGSVLATCLRCVLC